MIGQGMHGFVENKELVIEDIDKALHEPTDRRIFVISKAFRAGYTVDQIHELTKIDRWFLQKLYGIMQTAKELARFRYEGNPTLAHQSGVDPPGEDTRVSLISRSPVRSVKDRTGDVREGS